MDANRLNTEYWNGVEEFIKFVIERANKANRVKYPCIRCGWLDKVTIEVLKNHLFFNWIYKGYTKWIWHDDSVRKRPITSDDRRCDEKEEVDCSEGDKLEDMIHDIEYHFMDRPHLIDNLKDNAEKSLYVSCSKFTKLSPVLKLYNLKVENEWSDKSFTTLLFLLKNMLPEDNKLSNHTYDTKKILCSMGLN